MIKPFKQRYWDGRIDVEDGVLGKRWHQLVKEFPKGHQAYLEKSIVFLGFASDEGVRRNKGRVGAAKAPNVIREALSALPRKESDVSKLYDYGTIECVENNLEEAREEQVQIVTELLKKNTIPLVLGGGHEVALGNYMAFQETHKKIGIINIDSHFDLRIPFPDSTSGTPFYEMAKMAEKNDKPFNYMCLGIQPISNTEALYARAKEMGVSYVTADEIHENNNKWQQRLARFIAANDYIYLSLDMDSFDIAYAPGVSAPATDGLTPFQVKIILRQIAQSNKVRLIDVAELNPDFDIDNRTARLAAHMISEIVHHL